MKTRRRKLVEEFWKVTSQNHKIKLIAGIEPRPSQPYRNIIFYIRMESTDLETNLKTKVEPIWLSLNEMVKLSVLMTLASRFWLERLDKRSRRGKERMETFIDAWNEMSTAMDYLLEDLPASK